MKRRDIISGTIIIVFVVALLAAIAIPSFVRPRSHACQNACINNLRMIWSAKEQAAADRHWTNGQMPDVQVVNQYLKGNTIPTCPGECRYCRHHWWQLGTAGVPYSYNAIGTNPVCNTKTHDTNHRLR